MSGIFYTREPGTEGQILSGEGVSPGVGLDQLLDRDRPPLRAALEIGSAVADILCIAAEDGHVHGDIRPAHVKLDAAGAVSIEGYGIVRRATRAPEGRPDLPPADIYGLGLVMHASLSKEGMGTLPTEADGHDDAVVDRVLAMDFSSVSTKRWLAEVREFLCKILAFDPRERPAALDAANVLATVAGQCPGEGVADWAARAHLRLSGGRPPARQVDENLAGPVSLPGYFKGGAAETVPQRDAVRKAPSTKGESTAMWSREKLAAMFAEEDEDDAASAPVRSAPLKADPPATRSRHDLPAEPVRAQNPPPPRVAPPMATPATTLPVVQAPPPQPAAPRPSAVQPVPAVVQPRPVIVQQDLDEPEPRESGPNSMVIIGAVVALLVVLCAGAGLLGGGYFLMEKKGEESSAKPGDVMASDAPTPAVEPVVAPPVAAPVADPVAVAPPVADPVAVAPPVAAPPPAAKPVAAPPAAAPPVRPAAASAPAASAPASSSAKKPPVAAPAAATPASTPAAAPASTATSTTTFPVKFTAPGREGKVRCGDGQTVSFSGATTLSFGGTTTCLVQIDQGRGAVQVTRSTTVTCTEDAGKVVCAGGN